MIHIIKTYKWRVKSGLLKILPNGDFKCKKCFLMILKDTNPWYL